MRKITGLENILEDWVLHGRVVSREVQNPLGVVISGAFKLATETQHLGVDPVWVDRRRIRQTI